MPTLSRVGDSHSVRYRYSGRTIFFVEGAGDKNAYERIVGPGFEADLEFVVAPAGTGQGGCQAVRTRVIAERATSRRVFGLLDGEVSASFDGVDRLLGCSEPLFTLPGHDGFVFLGAHELENIYFSYADVCGAVSEHAPAARLHLHPPGEVAATLEVLVNRFARASIYKYASAHFHSLGTMRRILGTRIFGYGSHDEIRTMVTAAVTSGGGTSWHQFATKVVEFGRMARAALRGGGSRAHRRDWLLRIADGKEMLARLRYVHGQVGESIEGPLLKQVCEGPYPERFRQALFGIAAITRTTYGRVAV